ncbi:hypothetical protein Tco_0778790 [Tanacetum coccineum]
MYRKQSRKLSLEVEIFEKNFKNFKAKRLDVYGTSLGKHRVLVTPWFQLSTTRGDVFMDVIVAGAGTGDVCLSRSRALTISFNQNNIGKMTPRWKRSTHIRSTMALLRK